ncbi:MAG: hypothetical protein HGA85_08060 [Nanoarchaeota archaeon]|nr:hypothetical protein [Nanoarchaeota archaeon]
MRAQITIYVIIGILILLVGLSFLLRSNELEVPSSSEREALQIRVEDCTLQATIDANVAEGIRQETEQDYLATLCNDIRKCGEQYFSFLETRDLIIRRELPTCERKISDKRVVVDLKYPIQIESKNAKTRFDGFTFTLNREQDSFFTTAIAPDNLFIVQFAENTRVYNISGEDTRKVTLRIADKTEFSNESIEPNLAYGILPLNSFISPPAELSIIFSGDKTDMKIGWWNPDTNSWGFLPTVFEGDTAKANISYTAYYSIVEERSGPEDIPLPEEDTTPPPAYTPPPVAPGPDPITPPPVTPPPTPGTQYSGNYLQIYEQVRQEMNGPYALIVNPRCDSALQPQVYCYVGWFSGCGQLGVVCKGDKLSATSPAELNSLFRHEITHSIQQKNGGCPGDFVKGEWGGDYIGQTSYYSFKANGVVYSAAQLASQMISKGCNVEELRNAAFCVPGAHENLVAKGCTLVPGDVAEGLA